MSKSTVVLLIAEGYSISSNWKGNALFSSLPSNFIEIWNACPHALLKSEINDDLAEYIAFGSSISHKSNVYTVSKIMKEGQINEYPDVLKFFAETQKSNSALHLMGSLPSEDSESFQQLIYYLKLARSYKIFRVFIHLLLRDENEDSRTVLASINNLNTQITTQNLAEIATVIGAKNINDSSSIKVFQSSLAGLINGNGQKSLNAEQAIARTGGKSTPLNRLLIQSIVKQGKPVSKVYNFDSVLFFNTDDRDLVKLNLSLLSPVHERGFGTTMFPRIINIGLPFKFYKHDSNHLYSFFNKKQTTFSHLLSSNGYRQCYISDSTRINHMENYLQINESALQNIKYVNCEKNNYLSNLSAILSAYKKVIQNTLSENEYDFVMVDIPAIYHAITANNINKSIEAINVIDEIIQLISSSIKKNNGAFIFTSINNRSFLNKTSVLSPFIFYLNSMEMKSMYFEKDVGKFQQQFLIEILKKKYDIIDIAPSILDLFQIEKPANMEGQTLLKHEKLLYYSKGTYK